VPEIKKQMLDAGLHRAIIDSLQRARAGLTGNARKALDK